MKLRTLLTLSFSFFLVVGLFAQKANLKKANMLYDNLGYQEAIPVYLGILDKSDIGEAKVKLASCYRKIGDLVESEYWYGQVVRLPESEPVHKLYYAQALQANGKCDMAKEWFSEYAELVPSSLRATYQVNACEKEQELLTKNKGIYTVTNAPFNTVNDDFGTAILNDQLVYASESQHTPAVDRKHCWTGFPFLEIFKVGRENGESETCDYNYKKPSKFSNGLNTKFHDAAMCFSTDGSTMYFTRNNFSGGKAGTDDDDVVRLKIYKANVSENGNVSEEESLPFNSDQYSVAHPALSADNNTLYFASDMPGGFGGMDIYYSTNENGRWSPPMNLGPSINTEGNEIFPYSDQNDRLYIASNGRTGLGGLDVYYLDKTANGWGSVVNMGYPINTTSDDFALILNESGECGYFSSNREGGKGRDDIYSFKMDAVQTEILVFNELTDEPIEGATVLIDCNGTTLTTDADGKARIPMAKDQCCQYSASMEGFADNSVEGCTETGDLLVEIPLKSPLEFKLIGTILNRVTGEPIEGATISLSSDDCDNEGQTYTTDATGAYEFRLGPECCYSVTGAKDQYASDQDVNHCTRGLSESTVLSTQLRLMPDGVDPNKLSGTDPYNPNATDSNPYPNTPGYTGNPGGGTIEPRYQGSGTNPSSTPNTPGTFNDNTPSFPVSPSYSGGEFGLGDPLTGDGCCLVYADLENGVSVPFLLNVYYDYDQAYIRDDAVSELNKLYNLLVQNPEVIVEIGSHTDARGSDSYNLGLSQRRAEAVTRWLKDKGVGSDRLQAKGYGETQSVNDCRDFVPCSEEEHQMNRRTEFRVVGTSDGSYYEEKSQTPSSIKTDPCVGCPF